MFATAVVKMRKYDEIFLKNFIETENNYTTNINKHINKSTIKTAIIQTCCLNKQLKELNNAIQNDISHNWDHKLHFCENVKRDIKILLEVIKCNKLQPEKNLFLKQLSVLNKLKRKKKKKEMTLKKIYANKRKNRLEINVDNWMKLKQNEIEEEKEKNVLHKNADIVLSDVRTNRSDVKKFHIILRELENLRKVKVIIARERGEIIATEADQVFNSIIVKLREQWTTLDREYFLEEKGLNLMIRTGNEQKILKRTKNLYQDWEVVLFEDKIYINSNIQNSEHFVILRMLWDTYINNNGSTIPIGWIIPFELSCKTWLKCSWKKIK